VFGFEPFKYTIAKSTTGTSMIKLALVVSVLLVLSFASGFVVGPTSNSPQANNIVPRMSSQPAQVEESPADQETLKIVLAVAIEASRKAGDIILGNAGGAQVTKSKANSRDLLTLIDPLCEKVRTKHPLSIRDRKSSFLSVKTLVHSSTRQSAKLSS
jgi:hypothetical protein